MQQIKWNSKLFEKYFYPVYHIHVVFRSHASNILSMSYRTSENVITSCKVIFKVSNNCRELRRN